MVYSVCQFAYFYNTTVPPSILDGGSNILLANMLSPKSLICTEDSPHGQTFSQPPLCLSQQVNFMQLSFTDRPQLPPEVTEFL